MAQDGHRWCAIVVAKAHASPPKLTSCTLWRGMVYPPVRPDGVSNTLDLTGKRGQALAWLDRNRPFSFDGRLDPTSTGHLPPCPRHTYALHIRGKPIVASI